MKRTILLMTLSVFLPIGSAFAASRTIDLGVDAASSVEYDLWVTSPSMQDSDVGVPSGGVKLLITYPPPTPGQCPEITDAAFASGSFLSIGGISMELFWDMDETYAFNLGYAQGALSGSVMSGGTVNVSGASIVVNQGSVQESGSGSAGIGSQLNRTTSFASSPKTYALTNGSFTVTPIGEPWGEEPDIHRDCQFDLNFDIPDGHVLWTSPLSMGFDFIARMRLQGYSTF